MKITTTGGEKGEEEEHKYRNLRRRDCEPSRSVPSLPCVCVYVLPSSSFRRRQQSMLLVFPASRSSSFFLFLPPFFLPEVFLTVVVVLEKEEEEEEAMVQRDSLQLCGRGGEND